jgi:type IV fimbrial biogenesis protein FimT
MKNSTGKTANHGFTLIEIMITITVAMILLSLAVPSFRSTILNARMAANANEFVTAINLARSSAVRYQRDATVCPTDDFAAAVPTCNGGTDWSDGWIVWVDKDRDDATDADEILAVHEPLAGASTLTSGGNSEFTYDARGFGTSGADTLSLCDDRTNETGRTVSVNNAGRTSVATLACS